MVGRERPGRNGLDVTFVFAEIQAHLIFGYILFYPQFGNPVTDKFFLHVIHLSFLHLPSILNYLLPANYGIK